MVNKDDVTFDINNGLGANGEDELGEITVSYYLDKSDDFTTIIISAFLGKSKLVTSSSSQLQKPY